MSTFDDRDAENREHDRSRCSFDFSLHVLDKPTLVASLMDISRSGCRIMVDGRVQDGDFVVLEFNTEHAIDANVIWTRESVVGCQFHTPLRREVVIEILDRCRAIDTNEPLAFAIVAPRPRLPRF